MLKEKNVAILFEEENINTLEMAGELLLTILSSVSITFVLRNESNINYKDYLQVNNEENKNNLQKNSDTC